MYETLDVWSKDAIYPKKAKKIQVDQKSGLHSKSVLVEFAQLKRVLIKRCTCTKGNFNLCKIHQDEEEYYNISKKKDVGLILNRAWMMREANIFSRSGASEAEGRRSEASLILFLSSWLFLVENISEAQADFLQTFTFLGNARKMLIRRSTTQLNRKCDIFRGSKGAFSTITFGKIIFLKRSEVSQRGL